jgi:hypothetical protein
MVDLQEMDVRQIPTGGIKLARWAVWNREQMGDSVGLGENRVRIGHQRIYVVSHVRIR